MDTIQNTIQAMPKLPSVAVRRHLIKMKISFGTFQNAACL